MSEETRDLDRVDFAALMAGDQSLLASLERGERMRATTPFYYPARRGPVIVYLAPGPAEPTKPRPVRISDGGDLIKSLDEQGLDLTVDMVVSKTLFHAVKEVEGANVGSGEVYIDSTPGDVPADLWRFLQLTAELLGLRHSKYKDALLQLSRRSEGALDLINW
jgi:hypothetical protein